MKMANGGYESAYNIQFVTTNVGKGTLAVEVINRGVDNEQIVNMIKQVEKKYETVPDKWLVDNGYESYEEMIQIAEQYPSCDLYMPIRVMEHNKNDLYEERLTDAIAVKKWKLRMKSEEGQEIYKERAETAEWTNAQARNRGLRQVLVRGLQKVKNVALIYALTQNMMIEMGARTSRG